MLPIESFLYWTGLAAVAAMAAAGVLEAERQRTDLIGAIFIAIASALAGGTLRDVLLDRPVFWVIDQSYLLTAVVAGALIFFLTREKPISVRLFLYPDAIGLALFVVVGTQAALAIGTPWFVASLMGVTTGVFGGIARDLLCNRMPLVMQRGELYATAAWIGALVVIVLPEYGVSRIASGWAGMGTVLLIRLAAMHFALRLPVIEKQGRE